MAVLLREFNGWVDRGKKMGATHMISVCDTFDWDDYPVYVMPGESLEEKKKEYDRVNMQKINEVVDLSK